MKKIVFIVGSIIAILLAYYCVSNQALDIQKDIKSRLVESFKAENISQNINVEVSGRDVVLTGNAPENEFKIQAEKAAKNLYGVRSVSNQIQLVEPPLMPEITSSELEEEAEKSEAVVSVIEAIAEESSALGLDVLFAEKDNANTPQAEEGLVKEEALIDMDAALEPEGVVLESAPVEEPKPEEVIVEVAEPAVDLCQEELAALLTEEKINFASGNAVVQSSSYGLLNKIATEAKGCKNSVIHIHGYTDSSGDMEANRQLSLKRAKAVGKYLISKGVRQEIRVVGNGSNDPIAENDTPENRAVNRRIEFKVFKIENE